MFCSHRFLISYEKVDVFEKACVYIKDFRRECILAPLFKLLEASFELIVPLIMAAIIDKGIPGGDTGYIARMCLWLVALGGIGLLSSVTAQYFAAKAAIGFSARLRHVLMAHIQTLSYTELDKVGTSTLITRMNSDINQVQTGVNMTRACFCVRRSSFSARWSWRSPSTQNARSFLRASLSCCASSSFPLCSSPSRCTAACRVSWTA